MPVIDHAHHQRRDHGRGLDAPLSAVRWGVAGQIVIAWVLTIPACFLLAWGFSSLLGLVGAR